VFFVLSGFVLPISYLKSGKINSVFGSVFRRFIRLLIPVWIVHTIRYVAIETLWRNRWFMGPCSHEYKDMVLTTFFTVWFGDSSLNNPTWTVSVELWGSFFVYFALISL
jgi:peptidoglycan/LPS O-acetylase OafA/YrhL